MAKIDKENEEITMSFEEMFKTKLKSFEDGKEHSEPSEKTLGMFNEYNKELKNTNTKINNIEKNMVGLGKEIKFSNNNSKTLDKNVSGLHDKIDNFIKKADECYAKKEDLDNTNINVLNIGADLKSISKWRYMTAGGLIIVSIIVIPLIVYIWQGSML